MFFLEINLKYLFISTGRVYTDSEKIILQDGRLQKGQKFEN